MTGWQPYNFERLCTQLQDVIISPNLTTLQRNPSTANAFSSVSSLAGEIAANFAGKCGPKFGRLSYLVSDKVSLKNLSYRSHRFIRVGLFTPTNCIITNTS